MFLFPAEVVGPYILNCGTFLKLNIKSKINNKKNARGETRCYIYIRKTELYLNKLFSKGRLMAEMADVLSPETVHQKFKEHGVTHVVWLPDSETNFLFTLLDGDPDLHMIGVGREGNAAAVAAGLYTGGAKPVVLIQNTGLMESGDSIRGWLKSLKIPCVLMVGYRGYTRHGVTTDTAADFTEPFLNAFQINYYLVESDRDADRISVAFNECEKSDGPVAVLVADEFHGFNR